MGDLSEILELLQEVMETNSEVVLNDPELRKELWQVINYKLGMDERALNEICGNFDFRYGNYKKLYAAIREQMRVMDQIKNKRQ